MLVKFVKKLKLQVISGHSPQDVIFINDAISSREFIEIVGIFKVGAREAAERMLGRKSQHLAPVLVVRHVELALDERLGPLLNLAPLIIMIVYSGPTAKRSPPLYDFLRLGRCGRFRILAPRPGVLLVPDGGDGGLAVEADDDKVDPQAEGEQGQDDAVGARFRHDGGGFIQEIL